MDVKDVLSCIASTVVTGYIVYRLKGGDEP